MPMNNKISLFQVRNFSEKFSATFDFVRQNWRTFLRVALYIWLPLSLIQGVLFNSYYAALFQDVLFGNGSEFEDVPWWAVSVMGAISIVSMLMIFSVTYGLMKVYEEGNGDLSGLKMNDLLPVLKTNIGKTCKVVLVYAVIYVLFIIAAAMFSIMSAVSMSFITIALCGIIVFAAAVALLPPLMLFPAAYLLNDDAIMWDTLKTSFRYGFKTWGGLFAIIFVFGIIIYAASAILMAPGLLLGALRSTLFPATFTGSGVLPLLYTIVQDIVVIVTNFIAWLLMPLPLIAVGFHCGSAAELLDNVSVADDIDHFDDLADFEEDAPELDEPDADSPNIDDNNRSN